MKFTQFIVAGALAAVAYAQSTLKFTSAPFNVQAGTSYTLKWTGGDETQPVTITLVNGPTNNLVTIDTLTTSATGGSYTWNVPGTIADASTYAFKIVQGSQSNYWGQIAIAGGSGTFSITATSSASASRSAASTASITSSASSASSSASAASRSSASSAASSSSSSASASSASSSSARASSSSASASAAAPSTGAAQNLNANAALVLGAAAAIAYIA